MAHVEDVVIFWAQADEIAALLAPHFPELRFHRCTSYAELPALLDRVRPQVVFACPFEPQPFPKRAFFECESLEWFALGFAGIESIVPWDEERLVVTNVAGVASEEMAQYVLAAIFGLHQSFPHFAWAQARRCWDPQLIRTARGARIGLIGLGHAGVAIARMCTAVGLSVVACRSSGEPSDLVERVYPTADLRQMAAEVDVLVACCALTRETEGLIDADVFAAMTPGSYFINVARGRIVVEQALEEALRSGQLGGAVIDVTETEPLPEDSSLWDAPNLLITPHSSSEYVGWELDAARMFADNLERWLDDRPLLNRVSSTKGY